MRRIEREFGDRYFNAVLVELIKESYLDRYPEIAEFLRYANVKDTHRSPRSVWHWSLRNDGHSSFYRPRNGVRAELRGSPCRQVGLRRPKHCSRPELALCKRVSYEYRMSPFRNVWAAMHVLFAARYVSKNWKMVGKSMIG